MRLYRTKNSQGCILPCSFGGALRCLNNALQSIREHRRRHQTALTLSSTGTRCSEQRVSSRARNSHESDVYMPGLGVSGESQCVSLVLMRDVELLTLDQGRVETVRLKAGVSIPGKPRDVRGSHVGCTWECLGSLM